MLINKILLFCERSKTIMTLFVSLFFWFSRPPEELFENDSYDLSDGEDDGGLKPRRQHWSSKMQFVLACIGYSVGLSNVWRFPYIMYKSGGGKKMQKLYSTLQFTNQTFPCTTKFRLRWIVIIFHFLLPGVFLLPYFITLFICGIPLLFMELSIGQFTGRGVIGAIGQCCPLFKGRTNSNLQTRMRKCGTINKVFASICVTSGIEN